MVISFSVKEARNQLLNEGYVFTARKKRRKQFLYTSLGQIIADWVNEGRLKPKIADVLISEVGLYSINCLHDFSSGSGFKTTEAWVNKIRELCGDVKMVWVYRVTFPPVFHRRNEGL